MKKQKTFAEWKKMKEPVDWRDGKLGVWSHLAEYYSWGKRCPECGFHEYERCRKDESCRKDKDGIRSCRKRIIKAIKGRCGSDICTCGHKAKFHSISVGCTRCQCRVGYVMSRQEQEDSLALLDGGYSDELMKD